MKNLIIVFFSLIVMYSCEKTTGACDADKYVGTVVADTTATTCIDIATEFEMVNDNEEIGEISGYIDGVRTYRFILNGLSSNGCGIQYEDITTDDYGLADGLIDRDNNITFERFSKVGNSSCQFSGVIMN